MAYEVKQGEVTQEQWDEMNDIVKRHTCAECGGELTVHTNADKGTLEVGCLTRGHHGWVARETHTQALRRGEEIHPTIRDNIERKMMPKEELGRALNLLALRYPKAIVDPATASLFIMDCMRLDLDPLISPAEAVPIPFKSKQPDGSEKVTVTMVITEDGWLSMAARGCADRWAGSPFVEVVKDKELAKSLCGDEDAWLWKATGRTKDMEPGMTSMAYGYYTRQEYQKAKDAKLPAAAQPGNQARIRAIKRWVRENFPECRQKMMDLTAEWFQRAEGVKAAKEFIDAEYHFVIEPQRGGELATTKPEDDDKIGESPARHKRGEGTVGSTIISSTKEAKTSKKIEAYAAEPTGAADSPIDMGWLNDSLSQLKWSDGTTRSWIINHFKLKEAPDTLSEIISSLTRQQAEEFVKEIQNRVAQKEMDFGGM